MACEFQDSDDIEEMVGFPREQGRRRGTELTVAVHFGDVVAFYHSIPWFVQSPLEWLSINQPV